MADILTLSQARLGLGWPPGSHPADDADLVATYIPAVTQIIESPAACGRMLDRLESWRTDAASPITTPWTTGTIKRVVSASGVSLTFTGTATTVTITDSRYTAGDTVTITAGGLPTPCPVIVVARRVLARMWNADHQGSGSDQRPGGNPTKLTDVDLAELGVYLLVGGFA